MSQDVTPMSGPAPIFQRLRVIFHRMTGTWEQFWFSEVPSELFGLVRIAVGGAGLISLIGFMPVDVFWLPDGIAPPVGAAGDLKGELIEAGLGVAVGWGLYLVLLVSFACMTAGLFTSVAVPACFLGSVFQTHWNTLPLTSGHTVLVAVLFCLIWADCGARLSADNWRRRRHTADTPFQPIWPLRLVRIQIAMLYAASGLFKLLGAAWRDGSAIHYTTSQNVYGRVFQVYPLPANLDWTLTLLTYVTVLWEITFPLMLLNRATRTLALAAGVGIHLGIWATMEVGPFSFMILATYVAFLDPDRAKRLVQRWLGSPAPTDPLQAA